MSLGRARRLGAALRSALWGMFVPRSPLLVSVSRREMVLRLWQSRALQKVK
jgi:hypothetical protein